MSSRLELYVSRIDEVQIVDSDACVRFSHAYISSSKGAPSRDTGIGVRATIALLHQLGTTQACATVGIQFIEPPDT